MARIRPILCLALVFVIANIATLFPASGVSATGTTRVGQPKYFSQDPQGTSPQTTQSPADKSVSIKVDVDVVLLNISVWDRDTNRSITGLQKDDFQVYEDRTRQDVQQLWSAEAPFSLLLLLDVSGSTASYIRLMKEAATNFTREINEKDKVAVATFNSDVRLLQNFTSDRNAAARAIDRIRSGGGTAFYDALMTCLNEYMRGVEGRKAIVVFTDGVDNQLLGNRGNGSRATFAELYHRIQEVDTLVYTIFLDSEGEVPMSHGSTNPYPYPRRGRGGLSLPLPFPLPLPGQRFPTPFPTPSPSPRNGGGDERAAYKTAREQLENIADQTGGRMYSPGRAEDLSGAYQEIADDLRVQYLLSYASSNPAQDGRWRAISVEIRDHPEAVVRTRKGYYAAGS